MTFVVIIGYSKNVGYEWGHIRQSGFPIIRNLYHKEERKIAKLEDMGCEIKERIKNGELESVFEGHVQPVPRKRLELLWEIVAEADLDNLDLLEEKIYRYGSYLGAKDHLGRLLFVRMVLLLRNARSAEKMN